MKKLKIGIEDIALAMETSNEFEGSIWYLDTDTGEVIHIDSSVMEDIEDEDDEAIDDYPEWMKEMAEVANVVLADNRGRFKEIPKIASYESYEIMERFILDIKDERIRNRLFGAIKGKGAFRRFKNTISEWPELEKQWFAYRDETMRKEVINWLESISIEPEIVRKD